MINEKTLLDGWMTAGNNYEDFKKTLTELSDCTEFVKVNTPEVNILSLESVNEEKARFYELCPCYTGTPHEPVRKNLLLSKVLEKGDHAQLLKETLRDEKALFCSENRVFFPAKRIFSRGLTQFGGGGAAMDVPSYERDLYIASLFKRAKKSTFVVREIAGVKKLVSILSAKYKALPQSALCEIVDALADDKDLGKFNVYKWTIDNWISNIYIDFPDKAREISDYYELKDEFVPGLWLQTSDTGDASVKVYPTWRRGCSISFVEKAAVKRVHSSKVEIEEVIESIKKNAFAEYTRLPEAMCNLMTQNLTDESMDLAVPENVEKNRKMMERVLKNAFRSLNIVKAVGLGNKKSLFEQLCLEFSGDIPYTAYDVASALLSLPGRIEGAHPLTLHNLENAVSNAPYIKYHGSKVDEDGDEEIILV